MFTSLYVKTTLTLENFKKDQRGVTAIEYAMVGVAMAAIVGAVFGTGEEAPLRAALDGAMGTISEALGNTPADAAAEVPVEG